MNPIRRRLLAATTAAITALVLAACAAPVATSVATPGAPPEVRQALAPTGTLRIGVYPGSPTSLVRGPGADQSRGVTVELGRELARRLGVPAELVVFERVPEIVEATKTGRADVTLTNASPARALEIDFSPTVLALESGYLVGAATQVKGIAEIDRAGMRIGVAMGSTSQGVLGRELKQAAVVPTASVLVAAEMLRRGELDAFASNKAILFEMSDSVPGSRVLGGRFGLEQVALGLPKGREAAAAYLQAFVADPQVQALVQQAAQRAGLRGLAPAR